jgi:hypothetical protein
MTRRSKREIERQVEQLESGSGDRSEELLIAYEDAETGVLYASEAMDSDPLNLDAVDPIMIIETERDTDTETETV